MAEDMHTGVDPDLSLSERLGKATMNLLDHLAENYPGCELETCAVVVSVHAPEGWVDPDGDDNPDGAAVESPHGQSFVTYYGEDPRRWVQSGLLRAAMRD